MDIDICNIPHYYLKQEEQEEIVYTTQLKIYNDCVSLLEISDKILSTGKSGYDVVVKHDYITIREKNGHKIVETSKSKQKYVILYYKFLDDCINFHDFLFRCLVTPKLLVQHITMSYKIIIESLEQLEEISFSSFSSNNLVFDKNSFIPIVTELKDAIITPAGTSNDIAMVELNELYTNIIQSIILSFSLENTILNELYRIIEERKENESLLSKINKLYSTDKWDFVSAMKQANIETFHQQLLI
jgi:hypothetical protein